MRERDERTEPQGPIEPRIVAATDGEPWSPATWSGCTARLLAALERRGALAGAVSTRPAVLDLVERASCVSVDRRVWRQRYRSFTSPASPLLRRAMTAVGSRRAQRAAPRPDAVLQISGWYDAARRVRPRVFCTYQDSNLASWRRRPDLAFAADDGRLARAIAADRATYSRMDLIMTMSDWARRSFIEDLGQDPEKVVSVGAGANLDLVPEAEPRRTDAVRLLFVGRSFERKGGEQLLGAFRVLRRRFPNAVLWIVGPPARAADDAGVEWLGPISRAQPRGARRLDELFRASTALVMPSVHEPFGIALLEGMAYGLPCVGSDACAIPEIIEDGVTGFVAPVGAVGALAERLLALATDPAAAARMGERGRARLRRRFTWDRVAKRICEEVGRRL